MVISDNTYNEKLMQYVELRNQLLQMDKSDSQYQDLFNQLKEIRKELLNLDNEVE